MKREYITLTELKKQLREQSIDNMNKVKKALMKSDGQISDIEYDNQISDPNKPPQQTTTTNEPIERTEN